MTQRFHREKAVFPNFSILGAQKLQSDMDGRHKRSNSDKLKHSIVVVT